MRKTLWWRALAVCVESTGCGSNDESTTVPGWFCRRDIRAWLGFTLCLLSFGWAGCGSSGVPCLTVDDCTNHSCPTGETLVCTGVCDCDPGTGGTGGSGPSSEIEGTYVERYTCRMADNSCAGVDVEITMEVTKLPNGQYEIDDLGSNAEAIGTLRNGNELVWQGTDPDFPGFSENGTWTFDFSGGVTTFEKYSTFSQPPNMSGECTGSGILGADKEADPPPDLPCNPQ